MSFETPLVLLALLVVPLLVYLYVRRERQRREAAAAFTSPALLPNLVAARPRWRRHLPLAIFLVALAAMIVGVARPHATVSVPREEATVMVVIDTSLSMQATDVHPSRLGAARTIARSLIAKVPDKFRVGIVAFTGRSFVVLPPTRDRTLADAALANLHSGEGTALGDAIVQAVALGKHQRAADNSVPPTSVLVISDGAQTGGRTAPLAAAERARKAHVPVYAVVLGTPKGVVHAKLPGGYTIDIRVPPRGDVLRQVAQASGGRFFTAADDSDLRDVYTKLGSRLGRERQRRELTDVFAGGSGALLVVGGALSALWFRRMP
jgi:Ca-activated chloride channel family protein